MADEDGRTPDEELDAEAQVRRRLALAQIRQYPDPALRMPAREVEAFDEDLARLADRMASLMRDANGVGLAATQVGVVRRLYVFQPGPESEPLTIVNPSFTARSDELEIEEEGCLSLQGIRVPVERAVRVTVEGRDVSGAPVRHELEGLPARVSQHEVDHLDGVLIIDRTTPEARREALGNLRPIPLLAAVP
jgi:peptide deformylase